MCLYPSPSNVRCGTIHLSPRNQKSILQKLRRTKTLTLTSEIIHQRLRSTQRSAGGRWSPHYLNWTYGRMDDTTLRDVPIWRSKRYISWIARPQKSTSLESPQSCWTKKRTKKKGCCDEECRSKDKRECRCGLCNSCCRTRRTESNAGPKARRVNTHTWEAPMCGSWKILFMSLLWCWLWIHAGQDSTEMHHEHHVRQLPVLLDINSEWWILTAHLNRSAWFPLTFPLKWFEYLRMFANDDTCLQWGRDSAYRPKPLCVCRRNAWKQ